MPEESYIESLIARGARRCDPEEHKAFLQSVQDDVIPAIAEAERRNRIAVHNLRVRPIPTSKKRM